LPGEQGIAIDTVVTAFRDARAGFPDWGEAEALLALSEQRLAAGDLRGARDALEETLLIAPDYTAALELKDRIGALTAGR
jgi:Tfp pilus assembly protein PilF